MKKIICTIIALAMLLGMAAVAEGTTYRIGICCRDPEYASGLMLALNRISGGEIDAARSRTRVFTRGERAKKAARFLTADCREGGFARAVERFVLGGEREE